jgi:hypothetical protein
VIRNNTLRNNDTAELGQNKSCWWGAQIAVNNSQNVTITGNYVEAVGSNAICVVNATRHEDPVFPQALGNITVQGNIVKMRGGVTIGFAGDTAASNVVFSNNTYYVDNLGGIYWQYLSYMTKAQWQGAGQDKAGAFLSW